MSKFSPNFSHQAINPLWAWVAMSHPEDFGVPQCRNAQVGGTFFFDPGSTYAWVLSHCKLGLEFDFYNSMDYILILSTQTQPKLFQFQREIFSDSQTYFTAHV